MFKALFCLCSSPAGLPPLPTCEVRTFTLSAFKSLCFRSVCPRSHRLPEEHSCPVSFTKEPRCFPRLPPSSEAAKPMSSTAPSASAIGPKNVHMDDQVQFFVHLPELTTGVSCCVVESLLPFACSNLRIHHVICGLATHKSLLLSSSGICACRNCSRFQGMHPTMGIVYKQMHHISWIWT